MFIVADMLLRSACGVVWCVSGGGYIPKVQGVWHGDIGQCVCMCTRVCEL